MTNPNTDQSTIVVHFTDAGVLLSWPCEDEPNERHALHVPIDQAPGLACRLEDVVAGEVDTGTRWFVVQWYGGDVLLSARLGDGPEMTRWSMPMDTARALAAAIWQAIDGRDSMLNDGGRIGLMDPDDFRD